MGYKVTETKHGSVFGKEEVFHNKEDIKKELISITEKTFTFKEVEVFRAMTPETLLGRFGMKIINIPAGIIGIRVEDITRLAGATVDIDELME